MRSFLDPIKPMLAVSAEPFSSPDYSYEIKWDGYRAIAFLDPRAGVRLQSRNLKPLLDKFPVLGELHRKVRRQVILDGEIVSFVAGRPSFSALKKGEGKISYLAFDLLYLDGEWLFEVPLWRRQEKLREIGQNLALSLPLAVDGLAAFQKAAELGLEGIMAKAKDSFYYPGVRTPLWKKFKVRKQKSVVLGGYGLTKGLSLLAGAYKDNKLEYLGKVGTGFTRDEERNLLALFAYLERSTSPFRNPPRGSYTWLEPRLVGNIRYLELTARGQLRQASWLGLADKDPGSCLWEEF